VKGWPVCGLASLSVAGLCSLANTAMAKTSILSHAKRVKAEEAEEK
jgi:hypothetical protein